MTPLQYEMTQGDPFYAEFAFNDQYGVPVDLSAWTVDIRFKLEYSDYSPFLHLNVSNGGLINLATGIIAMNIPAAAFADIDINPRPRNGDLIPWRWMYGDLKMVPPSSLEIAQAEGARTPILIKLFMGVS